VTPGPRSCSFAALGTTATVLLAEGGLLSDARVAVAAELAAIDAACSRFRDDSDLARVNQASGTPVVVSQLFLEAMRAALRAAFRTEGAVDPTIGRAVQLAGYDRDFSTMPMTLPARRFTVRYVPRWRQVVLDPTGPTVVVPKGVALDLGATAKAFAADRAAQAAHRASGVGALVSLGGDVAVAGPPPVDGWRIGVSDDHRSPVGSVSQTVSIVSGGLATSSTTVRRWTVGRRTAHHLIDPRTGRPATGRWRTVSVAAGSCLDANTASTAAIVRGDSASTWLECLGLPARLVSIGGDVVCVAGWPVEAIA
jgi:FAD:protein FMN transferase